MAESKRAKPSSPSCFAIFQDIQEHLVRLPSSSISLLPTSSISSPYSLYILSHMQFKNSSLISPISISNFRFVCRGDVQKQSCRRAPTSTQFKLRTMVKLEDFLDSALLLRFPTSSASRIRFRRRRQRRRRRRSGILSGRSTN